MDRMYGRRERVANTAARVTGGRFGTATKRREWADGRAAAASRTQARVRAVHTNNANRIDDSYRGGMSPGQRRDFDRWYRRAADARAYRRENRRP